MKSANIIFKYGITAFSIWFL